MNRKSIPLAASMANNVLTEMETLEGDVLKIGKPYVIVPEQLWDQIKDALHAVVTED